MLLHIFSRGCTPTTVNITYSTIHNLLFCLLKITGKTDMHILMPQRQHELIASDFQNEISPTDLHRTAPRCHQIRVRCVTALIRFCSTIQQSPPVAFWVRLGSVRSTAGVARRRSSHDNNIIIHHSTKHQQQEVFPTEGLAEELVFVSFFFEICVLVSTGCHIIVSCMTSCLLGAKFSWIAASCSSIRQK